SCAAAAACASSSTVSTSSGEISPALPTNGRALPAGTVMQATFDQAIGTGISHVDDRFTATVSRAVVAQSGETVVPVGAAASGHVTGLHSGNVVGEQSVIRLDFDSLRFYGRSYPFDASISNVTIKHEPGKEAARIAATGAAIGGVLGAIVSGGELSKILTGGL